MIFAPSDAVGGLVKLTETPEEQKKQNVVFSSSRKRPFGSRNSARQAKGIARVLSIADNKDGARKR